MTEYEISCLVERIILIRDHYDMTREDRDALADACNLLDHNAKLIAKKE